MNKGAIITVGMALLAITAGIASAGSGTLLGDFEDGTCDWGSQCTAQSEYAYTGDYGITFPDEGSEQKGINRSTYENVSAWYNDGGDSGDLFQLKDSGSSMVTVKIGDSSEGELSYYDGSNWIPTGVYVNSQEWNLISIEDIDYSGGTYTLAVYNSNRELIGSESASFNKGGTATDIINIGGAYGASGSGYWDTIYANRSATKPFNSGFGNSGYEQAFTLDDNTDDQRFADGSELIVFRPDSPTKIPMTRTEFNHNDRAFVELADGQRYDMSVVNGMSYYERIGFKANASNPEATISIGSPSSDTTPTATGTGTPTLDERLDVRFEEFEDSLNSDGTTVTVESPEGIEEFDYQIVDENGTAIYNGTNEFDEPVTFYQGQLSDNATSNASEIDDPTMEYSGTFENGSSFNGTTELSFSDSGGIFGPTGSTGGGGGTSSTGGLVLLAGGAVVAAYRYRKPLTKAVSKAAGRLSG